MFALFVKEIKNFFCSLTGYIVIIVFLLVNGFFLWLFPGQLNIPENGYATLSPLFFLSPWLFLFLVPSITMKLLAEEKQNGTIDLLFTRPLTEMQIIMAKYLAGLSLVLLSLLPTLIYFYSVSQLGSPPGNIDTGGTWGSYIGLFFLAAIYVSIGLFASSLSGNQIISFIIAVVLSFIFFKGFDSLGSLFSQSENLINQFGINHHYESMSRGVIDSRDLVYHISVIALMLFATKVVLQSRKW